MIKARVDGRAFLSAALVGSGVGACLGAAFLTGGLMRDVETRPVLAEAEQLSLRGPLPAQGASLTHSAGGTEKVSVPLPTPSPEPSRIAAAARKVTPAKPFHAAGANDLECLTQAVYFEARGEGAAGQAAVAQVVLNRVRHPAFPRSVCGVVFQGANRRKGCQFSFACNGAMKARRESAAWRQARQVASRALSGVVMAEVGSATHFHTTHVRPNWGPQLSRVAQVGLHVFYRLGRGGSAGKSQPQETETVYARLDPSQDAAAQAASADIKLTSAPATDVGGKVLEITPAKPTQADSAPVETAPPTITPADAAAKPAADTAATNAS